MKYGKQFSEDMDKDPNMGMNPEWRKSKKSKQTTPYKIVSVSKDGKTIKYGRR